MNDKNWYTYCVHIYYSKFIDVNKDQNNNNILENIFIIYALFFFIHAKFIKKILKYIFFYFIFTEKHFTNIKIDMIFLINSNNL